MARPHERIFALIAAVLFLTTSLAFSGAVIWQIMQDKKTNPDNTQQTDNTKQGENMLTGTKLSGFTPVAKVEQIEVQDLTVGTGAEAKADSTVTANYVGALTSDGTIFDASADHGGPQTFSLAQVIKGWTIGVTGMKVGGKRRLLIPANLGYGEQGSPPKIGPNAALVFDIELLDVK